MNHPDTPLRLLFIGNSFTNRNDLPGLLTRLAAAASPAREVVTAKVIANGASLRQHWNAGEALRLLQEQPWDGVVLQEQSTLPVKNPGRYHENVCLFHEAIRKEDARTLLYLTWARQNAPETQQALNDAVAQIAREAGATVAPVGPAWERVRQEGPGPNLYDADGSHPSPAGSYLAACVFYATLFELTPEGLPAPEELRLTPEEAARLQRAAWAAVEGRLGSGG
jgi:hypothetical protein